MEMSNSGVSEEDVSTEPSAAEDGSTDNSGAAGELANDTVSSVFLKDLASNVLMPELLKIKQFAEHLYGRIIDDEELHIVLHFDNTGRQDFRGMTHKLEQGVLKILFKECGSAQQSFVQCIPIAFMDGGQALSVVLCLGLQPSRSQILHLQIVHALPGSEPQHLGTGACRFTALCVAIAMCTAGGSDRERLQVPSTPT